MIKVDPNGLNCHHAKIETIRSPDDRAEHEFSRTLVRGIHCQNHNTVVRMDDWTPQQRADWLLDGRRDELSICIKFAALPSDKKAGYFIRIPANNYAPDHLFQRLLRHWFDFIPDLHDYTDDTEVNKGRPVLLPPRGVELVRPARVEIVFATFGAEDWMYWSTPVRLKMLGNHIARAVNQFDAEFNSLEELELPVKSTMEKLAELGEKPKAVRKKKWDLSPIL